MNSSAQEKPVPQVALEVMMKRNKESADKLFAEAEKLLKENRLIQTEMAKVIQVMPSVPPTSQTIVAPPSSSMRPDPMGGLLHAADALVRSWKRRNKKNFKQLERDLMIALERMNA